MTAHIKSRKSFAAPPKNRFLLHEGDNLVIHASLSCGNNSTTINVGELTIKKIDSAVAMEWHVYEEFVITEQFIHLAADNIYELLKEAADKNGGSLSIDTIKEIIHKKKFVDKLKGNL